LMNDTNDIVVDINIPKRLLVRGDVYILTVGDWRKRTMIE